MRENLSTGLTCTSIPQKGVNKINFRYISPIRPESPVDGCVPNLAQTVTDAITCDKFFGDRFMRDDFVRGEGEGGRKLPFYIDKASRR